MARFVDDQRIRSRSLHPSGITRQAVFATALLAATWQCAVGQEKKADSASAQNAAGSVGRPVSEMSDALLYVFQAKNGDYWFGSNDRGVYRYDGKSLVNFTDGDGLYSNQIRGIQEDKAGNIYFTTYAGISRFNGKNLEKLSLSPNSSAAEWKNQPDDLWFVGPPDEGVVYRYDGKSLFRLKFPSTRLGDKHFAEMPRSKFPNAKYSPYDVYCILKDSKGNVWFGMTSVGVCRFDGKSFHWFTDPLLLAPVRSIAEDGKGNYWFSYSGGTDFEGPAPVADFGRVQKGAEGSIIGGMSIVEDAAGRIWTANYGAGAHLLDGRKRTRYPIREGGAVVLVFAIYKDNKDVLWLGTHNGGAQRFNGKTFERFRP